MPFAARRAHVPDAEPPPQWTSQSAGVRVHVLDAAAPQRHRLEQELLADGVALPFASRSAVGTLPEFAAPHFLAVFDPDDRCVGGVAIQSRAAPIVPGHKLLRVEHFGASIPPRVAEAAVAGLAQWVRSERNVLRLSVDVFSFDVDRRGDLGRLLAQHGFRRAEQPNGYAETLVLDLTPDETAIFASLHHSARRKVRQVDKAPLAVRTITDTSYGERMNQLLEETLARTGGQFRTRDWKARIALSSESPALSRIVGLFHTESAGPDALLAFAWGCHNGDHAFYSEAASTRDTGSLRAPLAYALMWDLMVWARRTGARRFDLGGITPGAHGSADPLGGISDFKRYFTQQVVSVRDEWILDSHSWKASLAASIHRRTRAR